MKFRNEVIEKIRRDPDLKRELIYQLQISEPTLYKNLAENKDDNTLTKYKAVMIISAKLAIPESELFENNLILTDNGKITS